MMLTTTPPPLVLPPPYAEMVCRWCVFIAGAVALGRRYLLPAIRTFSQSHLEALDGPTPAELAEAAALRRRPFHLLRPRCLTPAEAAEAPALRRRRLWCAVAGAAQGALVLALGRRQVMSFQAQQAFAVGALAATAATLLMELRLVEVGLAAAGLRRFAFARAIVAVLRALVRAAAIVGFAAAVWVPDE